MSEISSNLEDMKRYLFREMTEEESEAVEERIFADTEFYYELTELENDLVDRYVCGKLQRSDLERFERSLKLLPKRREKIANALALQSVIAEERVVVAEPVEQSLWEKISGLFSPRFSGWQLAAGALVVLIICVGGFLIYKNRQAQEDFAEIERRREAERIEKENRLRQLEEQKRLEEQQRRRENNLNNQLPENDNTQNIANSPNENKNINNEIEKLKKDIEDLQQKKDIPPRNRNEIKPASPFLAVAIFPVGRGGDSGGEPRAELQILNGKQIIKITKPLPEDKNYGSFEIAANGKIIQSKNITEGAKSIVFYLSPEIKEFEINAAERTTPGGSESLGTYELKLTKKQ